MSEPSFHYTVWRGIRIGHPAHWELASVSAPDAPGRCVFSDRHGKRLDVHWRTLDTAPNLDMMLQKYGETEEDEPAARAIELSPPAWRGLLREEPGATIVHAGRHFGDTHHLVETVFVWPDAREAEVEAQVLASIEPCAPHDGLESWQAMGIDLEMPAPFRLQECSAEVGHIRWLFAHGVGRRPEISVERLALPAFWLRTSLAKWLDGQMPADLECLHQHNTVVNGHPAEQRITRSRRRLTGALRRTRRARVDVAWRCPVEERVYRLSFGEPLKGGREAALPDGLHVACCHAPPPIRTDTPARRTRPVDHGVEPREPESVTDLLAAVPLVNTSLDVAKRADGSAVVSVPLKRPSYMVPPLSWILPFSSHRNVRLDPLGVHIVDMCRQRRPIEKMIEAFATEQKLSFREAQLAVMSFIRLLTERGIVAVAGT